MIDARRCCWCRRRYSPPPGSPEEAVVWMESLCRAFPTSPKEAEVALTELHRSDHAVEVSKIILGEPRECRPAVS